MLCVQIFITKAIFLKYILFTSAEVFRLTFLQNHLTMPLNDPLPGEFHADLLVVK